MENCWGGKATGYKWYKRIGGTMSSLLADFTMECIGNSIYSAKSCKPLFTLCLWENNDYPAEVHSYDDDNDKHDDVISIGLFCH